MDTGNEFSVAVLLSAYNGEKYIYQQIDSILSQELAGGTLHLYIRDDGSRDGTAGILDEYAEKDSRVTVIKGENLGFVGSFMSLLSDALNSEKKYDYYSLSDQDDVWDNDKIKIAIDKLKEFDNSKPLLYQCVSRVVTENLGFVRDSEPCVRTITFFNTVIQTFSPGHTYVFTRELLEKLGNDIDYSRIYAHDAYLNNLAALCGNIVFDNTSHAAYRQHGENQMGSSKKRGIIGWIKIRFNHVIKGESKLYAKQIEYISESLDCYLNEEQRKELDLFLSSRKNFFTRLIYIFKTKFYRQRVFEDILFRVLYLLGGYNT